VRTKDSFEEIGEARDGGDIGAEGPADQRVGLCKRMKSSRQCLGEFFLGLRVAGGHADHAVGNAIRSLYI